MPPADDPPDPLRLLLAQCIDLIAEGGHGAAESLLQQHPEAAPAVRERLHKLQRAGLLLMPDAPPIDAGDELPERLGDFRLLRRLGSGGMGVVYLALQESLGREVALKLVRPELLYFPGARERFAREVEAIARLNDPGIVPIYTVGSEQGIPYFAMEHVVGASLFDVVAAVRGRRPGQLSGRDFAAAVAHVGNQSQPKELSKDLPELFAGSWVETTARVLQRMALAAHHAHERTVLHRDLKPSNAMVTPHGRVLLLDFGLAIAQGSSSLTRTHAQLGTLHYMAPEALRGETVSARGDVYSLGVTLYELLALRPPFHHDSHEGLRAAILAGVPPPLPADVPRDLDTICRVAFDLSPERRYASAEALAQDLERFLQRRPIAARPAGPLLRTQRFAQRHPALAIAAGTFLLLALVTPVVWRRLKAELGTELQEAQRDVATQRAAADANLQKALAAIDRLLLRAHEPSLMAQPGFDRLRAAELDDAVLLLRQLRQQNQQDDKVRRALAIGLLRAGELRQLFGQRDEATALLQDADAELQRLPADAEVEAARASVDLALGLVLRDDGQMALAAEHWRAAAARLSPLTVLPSAPEPQLQSHSACLTNLAGWEQMQGHLEPAEAALRQAVALEARALSTATTLAPRIDALRTRGNLASLLARRGDRAGAQREWQAILAAYAALQPATNPELRREQARCHTALAQLAEQTGDAQGSAREFAAALSGFTALAAEFPDRTGYAWERNLVALQTGTAAAHRGDYALAVQTLRTVVPQQEQLIQRQHDSLERQSELAVMLSTLGEALGHTEDDADTDSLLQRAYELAQKVSAARPDDDHFRTQLGSAATNLGLHLLYSNQPAAARERLQLAAAAFEQVLAAGDRGVLQDVHLPNALRLLACAQGATGAPQDAVATLQHLHQLAPMPRAALQQLGAQLRLTGREDFASLLATARD